MSDQHIDHEVLEIDLIDDPMPRSSFGTIGRFVAVRWPREASLFRGVGVEVPYSDEDLGWVDPVTLRLFEIDVDTRECTLLQDSGADPERRIVYGTVSGDGIYGVVGLPADEAVMKAVQTLASLARELLEDQYEGRDDLKTLVAERYLGEGPPGAYDLCLGLELGPLGLPELQLLPEPSKWVPKDFPRPFFGKHKRPPRGPLIYALLVSDFMPDPDDLHDVAIEIVDTRTWTRAGGFSLGLTTAVEALAVSPDGQRIYLLAYFDQQVRVFTPAGAPIGTVSLPLGATDMALDSTGAKLYLCAFDGVMVVDTATLTVTKTVAAAGVLTSIALSPDGSTLAVANDAGSNMYVFDVATLTPTLVALTDPYGPPGRPIQPNAVVVSDRGRAVLWDADTDSFYEVVLFNGQQDQAATARMGRDGAEYLNYNDVIVYSAANGKVYAVKESKEVATKVVGLSGIWKSLIGGFNGHPFVPVMAPGGLKLWVVVTKWYMGGGSPDTIDEIDTISSAVTRARYTFSDPKVVRSAVAV